MNLENAVDKIGRRNWSELKGEWLAYIPTIDPKGMASTTSVNDLLNLRGIGNELIKSDNNYYCKEIPGMRELLFWNGTYLLHKASHAIGAAESHACNGIHTWALSSEFTKPCGLFHLGA